LRREFKIEIRALEEGKEIRKGIGSLGFHTTNLEFLSGFTHKRDL